MSTQAVASRICLRCRMHIFPHGSRPTSSTRRPKLSYPFGNLLRKSGLLPPMVAYRAYSSEKLKPGGGLEENELQRKSGMASSGPAAPETEAETEPEPAFTRIADADQFLASRGHLDMANELLKDMGPNYTSPRERKEREKDALKYYRVLLKDTKTDVDLDEVMTIATSMPSSSQWEERAKQRPKTLPPELLDSESKFTFPAATHRVKDLDPSLIGEEVVLHGFFESIRPSGKALVFCTFHDYYSSSKLTVQVVSTVKSTSHSSARAVHESLLSLRPFVPVALTAKVTGRKPPPNTRSDNPLYSVELLMSDYVQLNSVAADLIYTRETVFPPEKRHLQLRTTSHLYSALRLRARTASICRKFLEHESFLEVETPLLFKSTPEGAREFLVPTRAGHGNCYALPQSPQQYKQILMASGVPRYYQLAKCFRDEDLRADRQPEFTQLDLEMSFATSGDVMDIIERMVKHLWFEALGVSLDGKFRQIPYWWAMKNFGTDKPDMRLSKYRISSLAPALPIPMKASRHIEGFAFLGNHPAFPNEASKFLEEFNNEHYEDKDRLVAYVIGDGTDENKFHDAGLELRDGDVTKIQEHMWSTKPGTIIMVKERTEPISGGSTGLGRLRSALTQKAIAKNLHRIPPGQVFSWITEFPLFSRSVSNEPGQSGTAGLSSTHHPFTAPMVEDIHLLASMPERVRAEHYDLVVNGIELGGGSRRIHDAALQRYILEKVIKVHPDKIHQFDHLLRVLDSGCPPHAGIALGFDRLLAIMSDSNTIRDVIAFPKNSRGTDVLVGSPSVITDAELKTYGLKRTN